MSKTEAKIISRLLANRHGMTSVVTFSGRGPEGGRVNYGSREHKAAMNLVEGGVLKILANDFHPVYQNGFCVMEREVLLTWS